MDKDKLKVVAERVKLVIQNIIDELKRSNTLNLTEQLELAYEEIRRLAEELSSAKSISEGLKPASSKDWNDEHVP